MKGTLVAWLILFLSSSAAYALQVGDSENDVVAALGKPNVARKMSDGAFLWRFRDGTTVRLENGVVREVDGPGAAKSAGQQSLGTPAVSASRPVQASTEPSVTTQQRMEAEISDMLGPVSYSSVNTLPDGHRGRVTVFMDRTEVHFRDGVVQTITGPGAEKLKKGRAASSSTLAVPAAVLSAGVEGKLNPSRGGDSSGKPRPHGTHYFGFVILGLGILVGAACNIIFAVVAFRESIWWLLGCLFLPFVSLIFCITHWDDTKKIIGWNLLVAAPLIVGGVFMVM